MLKGRSKIELFDAKSGRRVHVQEKDNMVTNALSTLYSARPDFYVYNTYPICPNTLGGILLFPNALTEDVNNIYAPSTNFPVGYSSNDVNTATDTLRGSMNQAESGVINNGYKFVFDFATSQANGTISSLSLTHSMAGQAYYGSEASASLALINLGSYKKSDASYNDMWIMNNTIEIDSVNNYAYQLVLNARNSISNISQCSNLQSIDVCRSRESRRSKGSKSVGTRNRT